MSRAAGTRLMSIDCARGWRGGRAQNEIDCARGWRGGRAQNEIDCARGWRGGRAQNEIDFVIPGDIDTRTGGYAYDRRLIAGLRARDIPVRHLPWPAGFPNPAAEDLALAARSLAERPDGRIVIIDGLAYGAMPDLAMAEGRRLRLVALVHHPLALETGAPPRLMASERAALRHASAVIATSETTAETLRRDYDVPAERLLVAPPGTDPAPRALRRGAHILSLGSVTPRKGHDVLVAALGLVAHLPWRCTIAGSLHRAPDAAARLRAQIDAAGLAGRIRLAGEVEDADALYASADLFVLASRHEGFGMAYAEALACGLPVIGTTAGAIPATVPRDAGALVPPDDAPALAQAIAGLLTDPVARDAASAAALRAAARLPRWDDTVAVVAALLGRLG
jgi:glycosyltransferase involved in cell wall biosynthesis